MSAASIRYHYVITLQFERWNGVRQVSYDEGVVVGGHGESRADLFRQIFRKVAGRGTSPNPVPLFFSLEPDELQQEGGSR